MANVINDLREDPIIISRRIDDYVEEHDMRIKDIMYPYTGQEKFPYVLLDDRFLRKTYK